MTRGKLQQKVKFGGSCLAKSPAEKLIVRYVQLATQMFFHYITLFYFFEDKRINSKYLTSPKYNFHFKFGTSRN